MLKVVRSADADTYEPEPNWKRTSLCQEEAISIEHFLKPPHHRSPEHSHPAAQVLVVLEGEIRIETGDESEDIGKGDAVYIPGNETHIISNLSDNNAAGLDIFVPGRSFDFWLKRKK